MLRQRRRLNKKCLLRTIEGQQREIAVRNEGEDALVAYMLERIYAVKGNARRGARNSYAKLLEKLFLSDTQEEKDAVKELLKTKPTDFGEANEAESEK